MSKQISKRANDRDRRKQFEKKRRELAENPLQLQTPAAKTDIRQWPIVRAYVPVEDVFRATGFGSAGVVRQQPNGKLRYSFFLFGLLDEGITSIFGKEDTTQDEIDGLLKRLGTGIPPFQFGAAELAARYIWGAQTLSFDHGFDAIPESARYFALVPALSGTRNW
jgi:hypothetical protein